MNADKYLYPAGHAVGVSDPAAGHMLPAGHGVPRHGAATEHGVAVLTVVTPAGQ